MFNKLKLIMRNNELKQENLALYQENSDLRHETEENDLKILHSKILAERTLHYLNDLQKIDRLGISETEKIKHRNAIINELRIKNIDIKKELSSDCESIR